MKIPSIIKGSLLTSSEKNIIFQSVKKRAEIDWYIEILFPDGGKKAMFVWGQKGNSLNSIKFSITKNGCSVGSISFSKIDLPLSKGDILNIYYKNVLVYTGLLEKLNILKKTVEINPFRQNLKNLIVLNDYADGKDFSYILLDVLTKRTKDSSIYFSPTAIDNTFKVGLKDTTDTISTQFKSIEDVLNLIVDDSSPFYFWGVNQYNQFYVFLKTSKENKIFLSSTDYSKITESKNQNVEATRFYVFRESSSSTTEINSFKEYIGRVGFEETIEFPPIPIEKTIGIIEKEYIVDVPLSDTDCLTLAYQKLLTFNEQTSYTLKNVNFDKIYQSLYKYPFFSVEIENSEKILSSILYNKILIKENSQSEFYLRRSIFYDGIEKIVIVLNIFEETKIDVSVFENTDIFEKKSFWFKHNKQTIINFPYQKILEKILFSSDKKIEVLDILVYSFTKNIVSESFSMIDIELSQKTNNITLKIGEKTKVNEDFFKLEKEVKKMKEKENHNV